VKPICKQKRIKSSRAFLREKECRRKQSRGELAGGRPRRGLGSNTPRGEIRPILTTEGADLQVPCAGAQVLTFPRPFCNVSATLTPQGLTRTGRTMRRMRRMREAGWKACPTK
jgi:hypothetical protein